MLTQRQKELVIGSLLGDGCLEKRGNSVRFVFCQSEQRRFYVEWKCKELRNVITEPIKRYERRDNRTGRTYCFYIFKTEAHPWFASVYEKFYCENEKRETKKIVPYDIKQMLTPFVLAVWFMDDGSLDRGAPILNTQAYSAQDQFRLCAALRKFHLIANLNKDRGSHRIRVLKRHAKRFAELIKQYMLPEFFYKLPW